MDYRERWREIRESDGYSEFYFVAVALILAFGMIQTTGSVTDSEKPVVTVISCSMYPQYDVGDIIIVQGKDFNAIEEGDVLIFDAETDSEVPIIHRVIEKRDESLETQGDNTRGQHEFEKNITEDQVYGTAVFRVPKIGLVKILAMDLIGYSGDQPLVIDQTPQCYRV